MHHPGAPLSLGLLFSPFTNKSTSMNLCLVFVVVVVVCFLWIPSKSHNYDVWGFKEKTKVHVDNSLRPQREGTKCLPKAVNTHDTEEKLHVTACGKMPWLCMTVHRRSRPTQGFSLKLAKQWTWGVRRLFSWVQVMFWALPSQDGVCRMPSNYGRPDFLHSHETRACEKQESPLAHPDCGFYNLLTKGGEACCPPGQFTAAQEFRRLKRQAVVVWGL